MRAAAQTYGRVSARKYRPVSVEVITGLVAAAYASLFGIYLCGTAVETPWTLSLRHASTFSLPE
jgi:hypothetical protein